MGGRGKTDPITRARRELDGIDRQVAAARAQAARMRRSRLRAQDWVESTEEGVLRVRLERLVSRRRTVRRELTRLEGRSSGGVMGASTPGGTTGSARRRTGAGARRRRAGRGGKAGRGGSSRHAESVRGLNRDGTRRRATLIG